MLDYYRAAQKLEPLARLDNTTPEMLDGWLRANKATFVITGEVSPVDIFSDTLHAMISSSDDPERIDRAIGRLLSLTKGLDIRNEVRVDLLVRLGQYASRDTLEPYFGKDGNLSVDVIDLEASQDPALEARHIHLTGHVLNKKSPFSADGVAYIAECIGSWMKFQDAMRKRIPFIERGDVVAGLLKSEALAEDMLLADIGFSDEALTNSNVADFAIKHKMFNLSQTGKLIKYACSTFDPVRVKSTLEAVSSKIDRMRVSDKEKQAEYRAAALYVEMHGTTQAASIAGDLCKQACTKLRNKAKEMDVEAGMAM